MAKKTLIKTGKRLGAILGTCLITAGVIFAFTRPILAPGFDWQKLSSNTDGTEQSGRTFDAFSNADINNETVGKGVGANSYLIYDEDTGRILAAKNSQTPVAIASLTKLMTAYVVQKYGHLEDTWAITTASTIDIRPVLGLVPGDRVIVKDLVNGMLVGSANDAASALGAYITAIAQQPVTELMNQEAKALGMTSTHFENPIGFDSEQNYSTATDLKLLLNLTRPMSLFSDIERKQSYSFRSEEGRPYSVKATNTLLAADPDIHAIKTGFTDEAKGAIITAIYRDNQKLIFIVLASPDREADTKLLKDQVFAADQQ